MKILMLAPEPFFQPRGTPISVYFRAQALTALGHEVDLITYPLGEDVRMDGLRIFRLPNFLGLRRIKIGPSAAKVPLDAALALKALGRVLRGHYDLVHSHEEADLIGVLLSRLAGAPHVYDMHSSLPQQLANFEFTRSPLLKRLFARMERFVLRNSHAVIVICPDLMDRVRAEGFADKAILIENVLDFPAPETGPGEIERMKLELAPGGDKIILYAGNFGPYQGVSLLIEAAARLREKAVLVLLGGSPGDRAGLEAQAAGLGLAGKVVVLDRVAPTQVPLFVRAADVLVSPRMSGTNTPLKIYSFLKSGKPLVATRLYTHTQVLNDAISVLVEPTPEAMAAGLDFALKDPDAKKRAAAAAALAAKEYTFEAYRDRIVRCLGMAVKNFGR
jgi:glycosyltransferase involved in cell wall biosynthesis